MTLTNLSLNSSLVTGNLVVCVALFCSSNWMQRYAICDFLSLSWMWTVFLLYWLILHSHRCIDAILGKCRFPVKYKYTLAGTLYIIKVSCCATIQVYCYSNKEAEQNKVYFVSVLQYILDCVLGIPKGLQVDSVSANFWT